MVITGTIIYLIQGWDSKDISEKVLESILTILFFLLSIIISICAVICIEERGVSKYLNHEIIINKTQVTYDSQNQPIDTTYTYARPRNKNTD